MKSEELLAEYPEAIRHEARRLFVDALLSGAIPRTNRPASYLFACARQAAKTHSPSSPSSPFSSSTAQPETPVT